ncbi:MAG: hypothetical protein RR133_00840 [Kiritimatiellia bacterium]
MPALIVELDALFLGGFALASEVLSERLEKYGIPDNDPYRFVRKIYGKPFTSALKALLPETQDVAHVERRLAATYTALLQQNALAAVDALKANLRPLVKSGVSLAVITRLRSDVVDELFDSIATEVITVTNPAPIAVGVAPEIFQTALVALGVPVCECIALVACGVSVRSAVRVGLRACVVPDPMVTFENCAGADLVVDQLGKTLVTKLKARFQ